MFRFALALALIAASFTASAATLQKLSLDEMSHAATSVVRARITSASASFSGQTVYTHYKIQVSETLKGSAPAEFVLPGGVSGRFRQSFPGVPSPTVGAEYVLFLWTSARTGLTHPIGLSQGILDISIDSGGSARLSRAPIGETMLDAKGRPVPDEPPATQLGSLRARIQASRTQSGVAK